MKVCVCYLLAALMMTLNGQTPAMQDFTIKVGVEEVRIDATVLDKKGRQVTDLTDADFEVYQDGKRQEIVSCTYNNGLPDSGKTAVVIKRPSFDPMMSKDNCLFGRRQP